MPNNRYSYPYQNQNQSQAQVVNYNPTDYSGGDALAMQYLTERNKEYNEASMMPEQFAAQVGDMKATNDDMPVAAQALQKVNDDIQKEVDTKYNGDYALARKSIASKLIASKPIFNLIQTNYDNQAKAKQLYDTLVAQGIGPKKAVIDDNGNVNRVDISPDEIFGNKSVLQPNGTYALPTYNVRAAGDFSKWIDEEYSKALQQSGSETNLAQDPKYAWLMNSIKYRGKSDQEIQDYMFNKDGNLNSTGQEIVKHFLNDAPQASQEFANIKNPNAIGQYVANIIKGQTSKANDIQHLEVPADQRQNTLNQPINPFMNSFDGTLEDNAFATRKESMTSLFDKPYWFTGDFNNLSDIEKAKENVDNYIANTKGSNIMDLAGSLAPDILAYKLKNKEEKIKQAQDILDDYKKNQSQLLKANGIALPTTDKGWAEMYDSDKEYTYKDVPKYNAINPLVQKGISALKDNNPQFVNSMTFRLGNDSSGNIGIAQVADKLDLDQNEIIKQITNNALNYNTRTGEFSTSIDLGNGKSKNINLTFDTFTNAVSHSLQKARKILSDNIKNSQVIDDNSLFSATYNGDDKYTIVDKIHGQQAKDVDYGTFVNAINSMMAGHLSNLGNYGLNFTQQQKQNR